MKFVTIQQHFKVRWETAYGQYGTRWNTRTFASEIEAEAFYTKRAAEAAGCGTAAPTFCRITIEEVA